MRVPLISVGILSGKEIGFSFPKEFISSDGIAILRRNGKLRYAKGYLPGWEDSLARERI
jgi:hypothetical protein